MITIDHQLAAGLLPERRPEAHKGHYGHLFVLAGSRGFSGAAKLVALAAARSGTGLVTLGVPHPLGDVMATSLTEVMTLLLPATDDESIASDGLKRCLRFVESRQAAVLGPGLGQHPGTQLFVQEFTRRCPTPLVLDADGLNALSPDPVAIGEREAPTVITPHPGEMARLTDKTIKEIQENRADAAASFSAAYRCVVVLKGAGTLVATPKGRVFKNTTGNDGMATGGAGDVLAGLIGGFLAQGMNAEDAAILAVYFHGLAGDLAAQRYTKRAMIAGDLLDAFPEAFRSLESYHE